MASILVWVGLSIFVLGLTIVVVAAVKRSSSDRVGLTGVLACMAGVIILIISFIVHFKELDDAEFDRENRTTYVIGVISTEHQITWRNGDNEVCKEIVTLNRSPLTFEADCSLFVDDGLVHSPELGDWVRIRFVQPKQSDGKPEVLEVHNLTQKDGYPRSVVPPAAEMLTD